MSTTREPIFDVVASHILQRCMDPSPLHKVLLTQWEQKKGISAKGRHLRSSKREIVHSSCSFAADSTQRGAARIWLGTQSRRLTTAFQQNCD